MDNFAEMRCESCGRFMPFEQPGSSWAALFDFYPPGLRERVQRCRACTEKKGAVRTNARGCISSYEGVLAARRSQTEDTQRGNEPHKENTND